MANRIFRTIIFKKPTNSSLDPIFFEYNRAEGTTLVTGAGWRLGSFGRRHPVQNKAHCRPVNLQPVLLRPDNCKFHFDEGQNRGANVVVCCRGSALAIGLIAPRFCILPARSVTAINPLRNGGRACKSV